jgi:hypothetical protein
MGLDITSYSHLAAVGFHEKNPELNEGEPGGPKDWCFYDNHVTAMAYDAFPLSFLGLPVLERRQSGGEGLLLGGCYETTDDTVTFGFRAGSYGGYNQWRARLQEKYNPDRKETEPFFELIWFADNEGTIGSLAAQNLLADFEAYGPDAELGSVNRYDGPFYQFHKACKIAAEDGLIRFH